MSDLFGGGAMFLGTHTPRLDEKGRLILPARFRAQLAAGLVLTRGQERCLYLLPQDVFLAMAQIETPVHTKADREYQRVFLSGATNEVPDKQGRISIPAPLRTYAGLDREVAVIGVGARAEIWDLAVWEAYLAEKEASYADDTEEAPAPS